MEDSGGRQPTRQDFPHLTDAHWATLEEMVSLLGEAAFAGFPNLSVEQQKAHVERFDKYESSLIARVSAAAQDAARATMRAEAQSAAQASATNTASFVARPTTTKPVKMSELRSTFLLVNVAYRHRSNFLRCKQGKRSLQDYVIELHNLDATMAGASLSEDVKVTVFMDGVRTGPVRRELFRRQPKTFDEAVHIAMLEDHCVRSAQGHTPHVEASEGPTPMEISLVESACPQRTQRAGGRCFGFGKRRLPVGAGRPAGRHRSSSRKVSSSPASQKEQVPGTTLLCLSVAAVRSNLVVVTASMKGYPEPMTDLIDSGASFNFATKASVARNNALYASALEASKSNTNVTVRLATGSIVSTRKVTIPISVKFDDFNSVEPFIVLDMDDRYDLILGMPWLAMYEPWIDWRSRTIGAIHNPLADRALACHVPSASRDGFVHEPRVPRDERQVSGSSEVLELPTASPPRAWGPEDGVRADPEKVCVIAQWSVSVSQKQLRKWLGLANCADMARPLTNLLKKDAVWSWTSEAQQAFEAIKSSLQSAPILALPDEDLPFSVVCDASDFAIGCALLQGDAEGRERVVSFQSHELKAAEKNYPVHHKERLAMKNALVKFRAHLLGQKPFVIYTDHASLRTATSSPHLSQRMGRSLSFFTEYNFTVEYKPGKQTVLADARSRWPDYELVHLSYLESPLYELIRGAYADDDDLAGLLEALRAPNKAVELKARQRSRLHRYSVVEGLLYYQVDGGDEP
ncbi:unnamed protein product [Phytophthora fragariaefolia]|uniref:Unnamed protein product n=1 Tax=Phytophthora fragariaefolia TaxID=1490495 RepID=A0A9W6U3L5_9STRA|nr:unnamed protein product [Phytophthora fragariaefolia]